MLGNLDNGVIFKKAFTNKVVFKAIVKDILGIDVDVIETEKKFKSKIGYVDFELDIFADTTDRRIVIEIQRVEYNHHFDRFLYCFFRCLFLNNKKNRKNITFLTLLNRLKLLCILLMVCPR